MHIGNNGMGGYFNKVSLNVSYLVMMQFYTYEGLKVWVQGDQPSGTPLSTVQAVCLDALLFQDEDVHNWEWASYSVQGICEECLCHCTGLL